MCQTDGRTDRQTDGIAVASTALAIRALRRAVKIGFNIKIYESAQIKNIDPNLGVGCPFREHFNKDGI